MFLWQRTAPLSSSEAPHRANTLQQHIRTTKERCICMESQIKSWTDWSVLFCQTVRDEYTICDDHLGIKNTLPPRASGSYHKWHELWAAIQWWSEWYHRALYITYKELIFLDTLNCVHNNECIHVYNIIRAISDLISTGWNWSHQLNTNVVPGSCAVVRCFNKSPTESRH